MRVQTCLFVIFVFLGLVDSSWSRGNNESNEVSEPHINVYTDRTYSVDKQIYDNFNKSFGIKINLILGNADELIERIAAEGNNTDMDLLFLADVGRMTKAKGKGLLSKIENKDIFDRVPNRFQDPNQQWVAVTMRARVIAYDKSKGKPAGITSYEDLAKPNGAKVLVRSSSHPYNITLISHMLYLHGKEYTTNWIQGLVGNFARKPSGNDRDQMRILIGGVGNVAIVNSYYVGLLVNASNEQDREIGSRIGLIFPNPTNLNLSVVGLSINQRRQIYAIQLIEYLLSKEVQTKISLNNYEYPVVDDAELPELLESWGKLHFSDKLVDLNIYGDYAPQSTLLSDENGWK